jgi:hypothetical protein
MRQGPRLGAAQVGRDDKFFPKPFTLDDPARKLASVLGD